MRFRWLPVMALVAVCLGAAAARAEDGKGTGGKGAGGAGKAQLAWSFEKGAVAYISHEQELVMDVSVAAAGEKKAQGRTEKSRAVLRVEVDDAEEDGAGRLVLRYLEVELELKDEELDVSATATLDEKGLPRVRALPAATAGDGEQGKLTKRFVEQLIANLLKTRARAVVTPEGRVRKPEFDEDIFAGIGSATSEAEAPVLATLRRLFDADEFLSPVLAQTFVPLPHDPVGLGDEWKTRRSFTSAGMHMLGHAQAKVVALDTATARIAEKPVYDVDASGFQKRVTTALRRLYKSLGDEFQIAFEFEGQKAYRFDHEAQFDVRGGHVREAHWRDIDMKLAGKQQMRIFGRDVEGDMQIRMRGKADVRYTLQPPPGVTVPEPPEDEGEGDEKDDGGSKEPDK